MVLAGCVIVVAVIVAMTAGIIKKARKGAHRLRKHVKHATPHLMAEDREPWEAFDCQVGG